MISSKISESEETSLLRLRAKALLELRRRKRVRAIQEAKTQEERDALQAKNDLAAKTIRQIAKWRTDFQGTFCPLLDIIDETKQRTKYVPNRAQRDYYAKRTGRDIILKARRLGFTTELLAEDIHEFLTVDGAQVVIVCQSDKDNEAVTTINGMVERMFEGLLAEGVALDFEKRTTRFWKIRGKDATLRIIEAGASALSAGKKGRSALITRLHITEFAFFEFASVTFNAMLECVPPPERGGTIVIESTPNGASGPFYDRYQQAKSDPQSTFTAHFYAWFWKETNVVALDEGETFEWDDKLELEQFFKRCGLAPEQVKWYRRKVIDKNDPLLTQQENPSDDETCFLLSGRAFFDLVVVSALILRCLAPQRIEEHGCLRIFQIPLGNVTYVIGADPAEGGKKKGDLSSAVIYRIDTGEVVATFFGRLSPEEFAAALARIGRYYNKALLVPERNNHGHAVILALLRLNKYTNVYIHTDKKYGWPTNEVTRPLMLDRLDGSVRKGTWKCRDKELLGQMRTFIINDEGKPEAASGAYDDGVLAAAVGWVVMTAGKYSSRHLPDHVYG